MERVKRAESSAEVAGRRCSGRCEKAMRLYGIHSMNSSCIKNGKCATTEVVAASTPAPVSRGSRNRYAELAQGAKQV